MAITGLTVTTDRTSYSQYEPGRDVITATVVPTGGSVDDIVTVTLQRPVPIQNHLTTRVLGTVAKTLGAGDLAGFVVTFDLSAQDDDGFRKMRRSHRRNDYQVQAKNGAIVGIAKTSILLITVDEMRGRWLTGLPLYEVERLAPRVQPQTIAGVTVQDVSRTSAQGLGTLTLTVTAGPVKTLKWRAGTAVTITTSGLYTLSDPARNYIIVQVNAALLPGGTTSEPLFIDYAYMADDTLMDQIIASTEETQRGMQVQLEPTIAVSQSLADPKINLTTYNPDYDIVGLAVTYYKVASFERWLELQIPFQPLLKVMELSGYLNLTRIVQITNDWIRWNEMSGHIDLVPSNAAIVQWTFYGAGFYTFSIAQPSMPDFWQYRALVGLRVLDPEIIEFIGMRAAIPLLMKAGLARYPAGITSQSVSRDGVSESRSLNPRGAYAGLADAYREATGMVQGKDLGIQRLRQRYRGIIFTTL